MNMQRKLQSIFTGLLVLLALSASSCDKDENNSPSAPPVDSDGDGITDKKDDCPSLFGEAQYNGCPYYKVDVCSGYAPYSFSPYKWSNLTPVFYYGTSLPAAWRVYADYAASTWNSVGSKLTIMRNTTPVAANVALDGKSVVCYGPIETEPGETVPWGVTCWWYNASTHYLIEVDIKLNSNMNITIGGSATAGDAWSILTHEFGHFCGLNHVNDRTHTMYTSMPPGCIIYRTLCAGDNLGLRQLYP